PYLRPNTARLSDGRSAASDRAVLVALGLLRAYQIFLAPLCRGCCRFVPSCSAYAAEAIRRHGVTVGSWMAIKRLLRCHPLCAAGFDPVD
ncbi:MAG: membrane protein insertion efficiency factor YidD, partial [Acidimicrobiia bacterium]